MEHPGYEASDEEVTDFWRTRYSNFPSDLLDEVIARDLAFKNAPPLIFDGIRWCEHCQSWHPHFKGRNCNGNH